MPSPLDCFLVLRGLKTLHLRMARHAENALQLARFLEAHPQVEKVTYPGLPSHPQHALARRQMTGFGGMLTFVIRGGLPAARAFLEAVKVFACAESLGGVESLIEHPAIMTHASVPPRRAGPWASPTASSACRPGPRPSRTSSRTSSAGSRRRARSPRGVPSDLAGGRMRLAPRPRSLRSSKAGPALARRRSR